MEMCPLLFFHRLAHPPWNIMGSKVMQRIPGCYKNWAIYRKSMLIWLYMEHAHLAMQETCSSEYAWYVLIWLYIEHVRLSMCGTCSSDYAWSVLIWLCIEYVHLTIHRTCLPGYALRMFLSTCIDLHTEERMCFYFPDQNKKKYHHSWSLGVHNRNVTIKKKQKKKQTGKLTGDL